MQDDARKLLGVGRSYLSQIERDRPAGPRLVAKFEELEGLSAHALRAMLAEMEAEASEQSAHGTPMAKVKAAMRQRRLSAADLARAIHRDIGPVQHALEHGRASEGMIEDFCRVLDLDKAEIMENADTVRVMEDTGTTGLVGQKPLIQLPPGMHGRYVPLLSFCQAGQYDLAALDEGWTGEGFIAFGIDDRSAFALRIKGDSMTPKINEGDIVIVAPKWSVSVGDDVVAKTIDGEVFCKVWGGRRDGAAVLLSVNTLHPELRIPEDQIAWIYPVAQHTRNTRRS